MLRVGVLSAYSFLYINISKEAETVKMVEKTSNNKGKNQKRKTITRKKYDFTPEADEWLSKPSLLDGFYKKNKHNEELKIVWA